MRFAGKAKAPRTKSTCSTLSLRAASHTRQTSFFKTFFPIKSSRQHICCVPWGRIRWSLHRDLTSSPSFLLPINLPSVCARRAGYPACVCVFVHLVGVGDARLGWRKGESARGDRTPGRFVLMLTTPKPQQLTVQTISLIVADRSDAVAATRHRGNFTLAERG